MSRSLTADVLSTFDWNSMPIRPAVRLFVLSTMAMMDCSSADAAEAKPLTFEDDIRPIFRSHCYDCHGSIKEKKGKLDLRLARVMIAGGETGPAIVAGDPDGSFLVKRLRDGSMPPGDVRVSDEEIAKISQWITQGAKPARPEPKQIGAGLGTPLPAKELTLPPLGAAHRDRTKPCDHAPGRSSLPATPAR